MDENTEQIINIRDQELFNHIEEVLTTEPDPKRVAWILEKLIEIDKVSES
jgi:hypothetical protein